MFKTSKFIFHCLPMVWIVKTHKTIHTLSQLTKQCLSVTIQQKKTQKKEDDKWLRLSNDKSFHKKDSS